MPTVQWEWKIGPQTVISALLLIVTCIGFVKFFWDVETEVRLAQQDMVALHLENKEIKTQISTVEQRQHQVVEGLADTKAKVDVMLPIVQRIEDFLLRRGEAR